jgi:hypothetical protein
MSETVDTTIQFGTGWNCCAENPAKVVVWDSGARWAVCKSCASRFIGEVQELPLPTSELACRAMEKDTMKLNIAKGITGINSYKHFNRSNWHIFIEWEYAFFSSQNFLTLVGIYSEAGATLSDVVGNGLYFTHEPVS